MGDSGRLFLFFIVSLFRKIYNLNNAGEILTLNKRGDIK